MGFIMTDFSPAWLSQRIVADSRDAVILADREGIIRLWNVGAVEMFGYAPDEAWGGPWTGLSPRTCGIGTTRATAGGDGQGVSKYAKDLLGRAGPTKYGRGFPCTFIITLVRDAEGRIIGAAAILRDVTARWQRDRESQKRLAVLEARLEELEKLT